MNTAELEREFRRAVSEEIDVEREGNDRYIVHTPFMFNDGDHFVIVLKRHADRWRFTDEGHTFMHMGYGEIDLSQGTGKSIIDQVLLPFHLTNDAGELCLKVADDQYGDALFSFIQALARIGDAACRARERVRPASMGGREMREMLALLTKAHEAHPELRLGQLIVDAASKSAPKTSVFYVSDGDLMAGLVALIDGKSRPRRPDGPVAPAGPGPNEVICAHCRCRMIGDGGRPWTHACASCGKPVCDDCERKC